MNVNLTHYKVNPRGIAGEQFGNEIVLINLIKGNYYNITDSSAILIWTLLSQQPITVQQISEALTAQFDVDALMAAQAAEEFIQQLLAEELIVETSPGQSPFTPVQAAEPLPFVKPLLVVFDDMQELIVLDPVHDIDAQKGWPFKK